LKEQSDRYPAPQYWVAKEEVDKVHAGEWALGLKDVTAPTNVRTMIAAIVPAAAFGNTLPLLAIDDAKIAVLILANLNSFAFDFLARQKVQGQHLNWYILEQIPVIAPAAYEAEIGGVRIADFIRNEVLALSYTAHDLAPFARDLGYVDEQGAVKPPYLWSAADRKQRMARLDALFFHLYGLSTAEADYILSTFPIVALHDQKAHGKFLTRDLILAQMEAIADGKLIHADLPIAAGELPSGQTLQG